MNLKNLIYRYNLLFFLVKSMSKVYNVTRESAAQMLGISTRTIDRYIRGGKLSYKKVANKVLLERGEVNELKDDFAALNQELSTEIVNQSANTSMSTK